MTEKRSGCIEPRAVRSDDLIAWALGEAPPAVARHIEACPSCHATASRHAGLDRLLRGKFFRRACPASTVIGEYALGMLPTEEAIDLAGHLLECPHCRTESRAMSAFLSEPDEPLPETGVIASVRRLLARPLATPEPAVMGYRGAIDESTITYTADGLRLTVSVQPAGPGRTGAVLVGLLEQDADAIEGAFAQLYAGDRLTRREAVDDLGNFLFNNVPSGEYRIEVTVPEAIVEINSLRVP